MLADVEETEVIEISCSAWEDYETRCPKPVVLCRVGDEEGLCQYHLPMTKAHPLDRLMSVTDRDWYGGF